MISDERDPATRHRRGADTANAAPATSLVPPQAGGHPTFERTPAHDRDDADESHLVRGYD